MWTTVEQKTNPLYTEVTEKFYQGMTRDEAKEINSFREGIFSKKNAGLNEFIRIDRNWDGVLSKDEISDELSNNIEAEYNSINNRIGLSLFYLMIAKFSKHSKSKRLFLFGSVLSGLSTLPMLLKKKELQTRLAQGHN